MQIPAITGLSASSTAPLAQFVQRLTAHLTSSAPPPARQGEAPESQATLTPTRLRATLLEMGAAADMQNLALAEAFVRLGLPLTRAALAEAHAALAGAPEASPRAYALARAWALPTTPAALNALTVVTDDAPVAPQEALPPDLLSWLGLAADAGSEPGDLAAHLFLMAQGLGRSTENRLAAHPTRASLQGVQDAHSTLLRLAQGSADRAIRRGADTLAAHIEGQQLINQVTRRGTEQSPFYLAVPVLIAGEPSLAEMLLGVWDDEQETEEMPPGTPWVRAVARVATARLGRVQAALTGTLDGALTCRLGAEKPATARLLQRHAGLLSASLGETGDWRVGGVECQVLKEWPPLWHGGDALTAPRPCVDWRA